MDWDKRMEALLEEPYFVMDFLPEQVPPGAQGEFFRVEQYFLGGKELEAMADSFARVLLKLWCYFPMDVYQGTRRVSPDCKTLCALVKKTVTKRGNLSILLPGEDTLITAGAGTLNLTVYHPSADAGRILAALAAAEGLFWRAGPAG